MNVAHTHHRGAIALALTAVLVVLAVSVFLLVRNDSITHSSSSGSTVQGSGTPASETRVLPPFQGVELAGSTKVAVTVGATQKVVVHADDNLVDHVTTAVEHGTLVVRTTGSFTTSAPMRVDVTAPSVEALTLSGSGLVTADGVDTQALAVELSGSGVLYAHGTVGTLDVSVPGAGDAELGGLTARDAHAAVSGSGRILVHVTNSLEASVSGTGAIMYTGNPPLVTKSVTGTGAIVATG